MEIQKLNHHYHGQPADVPNHLRVDDHSLLKEVLHGLRALSACADPFLDSRGVEVGLLAHWVIVSEELQGASLAGFPVVNCDDAVERSLAAAAA